MVLEEVHGLHATNITLHKRFSLLIAKGQIQPQKRNINRNQNRRLLELELLKQRVEQTRRVNLFTFFQRH